MTAAGTATIAGRGVVVVVGPTPEGSIVVAALDPNDCSLIDSAPLPSA